MEQSIDLNLNLTTTLLLSEFDITEGASLRLQFPKPINGLDTNKVAELMLPDGAEKHDSDWTQFFIRGNLGDPVIPEVAESMRIKATSVRGTVLPGSSTPSASRPSLSRLQSLDSILPLSHNNRANNGESEGTTLMPTPLSIRFATARAATKSVLDVMDQDREHHESHDSFVFVEDNHFIASIYRWNEDESHSQWILVGDGEKKLRFICENASDNHAKKVYFMIVEDDVGDDDELKLKISHGPNFNLTLIEDGFFCLFDDNGEALGIRFGHQHQQQHQASTTATTNTNFLSSSSGLGLGSEVHKFIQYCEFMVSVSAGEGEGVGEGKTKIEEPKPVPVPVSVPVPELDVDIDIDIDENVGAGAGSDGDGGDGVLNCLSLVRTKADPTNPRGAVSMALAICSTNSWISVLRPVMVLTLEKCLEATSLEERRHILSTLWNALKDIEESCKSSVNRMQVSRAYILAHRAAQCPPLIHYAEIELNMQDGDGDGGEGVEGVEGGGDVKKIPLKIPLDSFPEDIGGPDVTLTYLVKKFGVDTMRIFNAILAGESVLFVGDDSVKAWEVCRLVLASVLLVSPPLEGLIDRAFPYASLAACDFLESPGYIAGTKARIFCEERWGWHVLCKVSSREDCTVVINAHPKQSPSSSSSSPTSVKLTKSEVSFMNKITAAISMHRPDAVIKGHFTSYLKEIGDVASGLMFESNTVSRTKAVMAHSIVANKWKQADNTSYNIYEEHYSIGLPLSMLRVMGSVWLLKQHQTFSEKELISIYDGLIEWLTVDGVEGEGGGREADDRLFQFLYHVPATEDGLHAIAATGLFHESKRVRMATVSLLQRIEHHVIGKHLISSLNPFIRSSYEDGK